MSDPAKIVEAQDAVERLEHLGFGGLLEALRDETLYTKAGRLVLAKLSRKLQLAPRQVQTLLLQAQTAVQ